MTGRRACDVFVECLENEGVRRVFGIPGEETLDLNHALHASSIDFVPVRHEQGGAYMADVTGRLTGRAGVCLGTLGPGALNLVTAVADAYLDRAPLVALTGQRSLEWMHKESHKFVDLIEFLRPITKWNARVASPNVIPEVVRKAFKVAEGDKPGATHLELPEDVMAQPYDADPLPRRSAPHPEPGARELARAAELVCGAASPIVLAGNGVLRARAAGALREFARSTGIPVAETFMGKGALDYEDPQALGTVGLHDCDYELAGFDEADVVIAVGYDLVEHAPEHWNPHRDKTIVVIDATPAEIDAYYTPAVEVVGNIGHVLAHLAEACRAPARKRCPPHVSTHLRDVVLGHLEAARNDDGFPMRPPRALWELRDALGPSDMLVSDVGLHKLWIARMFPAHEPNTVLIANGLAGMGFALPGAIAAKLVHPDRSVVAVCGDGG
ncbi:MAG: acetolactate synthase large subunit, partial [Gaiellales bacterium]|nr:acetolactate synthase large subunit [Gaiellales bacterium]